MGNAGKKIRVSYAEIIVVAIVLGIAGKMIAPQFTEASNEGAKVSELVDGLGTMRAQLDLYRARHGDCFPPTNSFVSFETAMTTREGRYGPYVKKIPTNPFNGLKTVRFDGEPAGVGKAGWRFDAKTGLFQADNDAEHAAL
jgi:type II secretory pathway pseudopilin PulG